MSALFTGVTSKHVEDFCCLNCLHSFRTKNKFKKHENVCKIHDYCCIEIPEKSKNILKYNHGEKYMKVPFIVYADTESLLKKMDAYRSNPGNLSTTKIIKHTASGYSLFTHCSFANTKNKHNCNKGKDCMKNFSGDLKKSTRQK